jgi:hypothetical protein
MSLQASGASVDPSERGESQNLHATPSGWRSMRTILDALDTAGPRHSRIPMPGTIQTGHVVVEQSRERAASVELSLAQSVRRGSQAEGAHSFHCLSEKRNGQETAVGRLALGSVAWTACLPSVPRRRTGRRRADAPNKMVWWPDRTGTLHLPQLPDLSFPCPPFYSR